MAREDWQDREEERRRAELRAREDFGQADYSGDYGYDARRPLRLPRRGDVAPADDYGQADYSTDYGYDPSEAYRRHSAGPRLRRRMDGGDYRPPPSRVPGWTGPGPSSRRPARPVGPRAARRRGPSDRVLWAVIVERLDDERGLDLRDVRVIVEDAEVTLSGTVRHKGDKRRIEDVAEIDGVRHVQNNLRLRAHSHWTFL